MSAFADLVALRRLRGGERGTVSAVFAGLSQRSRRLRFLSPVHDLSERQLDRLVDVGCCGREAVVATDRETGDAIGIGRYVRDEHDHGLAEVAFEVVDAWQGRGVGRRLADELRLLASADGIRRFQATVASENSAALALLRGIGPVERTVRDGPALELTIRL
jgi:RimJ/RimL family protein N-acetyltransferase